MKSVSTCSISKVLKNSYFNVVLFNVLIHFIVIVHFFVLFVLSKLQDEEEPSFEEIQDWPQSGKLCKLFGRKGGKRKGRNGKMKGPFGFCFFARFPARPYLVK